MDPQTDTSADAPEGTAGCSFLPRPSFLAAILPALLGKSWAMGRDGTRRRICLAGVQVRGAFCRAVAPLAAAAGPDVVSSAVWAHFFGTAWQV